MTKREEFFKKLYPFLLGFSALFNIAWGIYYIVQAKPYYYILAFCSLLFIPIVELFYKLLHFKPVYQLNAFIYIFIFMLYTLGLVLRFYSVVPYYDKVAHTLSGVFVSFLGLILFYLIKPNRKIEEIDFPLASVFTVAVSMAMACFWEICEYVLSLVVHNDPQMVAATGIQDTMLDMIVCTIGALLMLIPYYFYYKKKKVGFMMGGFQQMVQINLQNK